VPPPQSVQDPLAEDFNRAMRRLAATVTIITANDGDSWCGMVATAVMSLSADPPSLVIGVNRSAGLHRAVTASGGFCVNLLSEQHQHLVGPFSGKLHGAERFKIGQWKQHTCSIPYLEDAMANLFCDVDSHLDHATHTLFIGSVQAVTLTSAVDALIWKDGTFVSTAPKL
jgi:flavin reductase